MRTDDAPLSREECMVVIERDESGKPTVWCDPEIVDLVSALNAGGVRTVASCSGHGEQPGNIALADGRELIIAGSFAEARAIERSAELARRVERAPAAEIDDEQYLAAYPVDYSDNYDAIKRLVGKRVRLVPVEEGDG